MRLGRPQTRSGRFCRGICLSFTWIRSPDHWACSTVPIPGLANLWHAERFRWYAIFTAVPIFFIFLFFARPLSLYCDEHVCKYSRVSFCYGSLYDDSLLRPLSSRTEHYRLVVHHCPNSSVLSLLSAFLALFRCACVSSFSILVQFF